MKVNVKEGFSLVSTNGLIIVYRGVDNILEFKLPGKRNPLVWLRKNVGSDVLKSFVKALEKREVPANIIHQMTRGDIHGF